ncbi:MAG: hypothetical protein KatS3mg068_1089 [Candidatus Sericytochromatia bacterium]|nr:MAG: hypothetical protein KatS3mg068_1089 [Candidatus Sericytochromatia bacterium]
MKITIIASFPDLEVFSRLKWLYSLLNKKLELQLIAITFNNKFDFLLKNIFENICIIKYNINNIITNIKNIVNGDIIYVLKARTSSFGISINLKRILNKNIILDISDIEKFNCFPYSNNHIKSLFFSFPFLNNPDSYLYTYLTEKRVKFSDGITVSNSFLQKIYGGTLINDSCDINLFNKDKYKINEIRQSLKWDKKVIIFNGHIKNYLDINIFEYLLKKDLIVVFIGFIEEKIKRLFSRYKNIIIYDYQNDLNIAKMLSSADYLVLFRKNLPNSDFKIPIKIYEAMACNLTVITNETNNYKELFKGNILYANSYNEVFNIIDNNIKIENSRNFFKDSFSKEEIENKLFSFISSCYGT